MSHLHSDYDFPRGFGSPMNLPSHQHRAIDEFMDTCTEYYLTEKMMEGGPHEPMDMETIWSKR